MAGSCCVVISCVVMRVLLREPASAGAASVASLVCFAVAGISPAQGAIAKTHYAASARRADDGFA
jgi:hypothetical protein